MRHALVADRLDQRRDDAKRSVTENGQNLVPLAGFEADRKFVIRLKHRLVTPIGDVQDRVRGLQRLHDAFEQLIPPIAQRLAGGRQVRPKVNDDRWTKIMRQVNG